MNTITVATKDVQVGTPVMVNAYQRYPLYVEAVDTVNGVAVISGEGFAPYSAATVQVVR